MSLRPEDDRNGRSGRSHSRTRERSRSRDARAPSPNPKTSSSSTSTKDTRKARFADDPKEEPKSRSAAPEPEVAPRYDIRQPSTVAPGLSSLSSSRKAFVAEPEEMDDDDDEDIDVLPEDLPRRRNDPPYKTEEPSYRTGRPQSDARSSRGVDMPSLPSMPESELPPRSEQSSRTPRNSLPYPIAGGGMYPGDSEGPYTMMPAADYVTPSYATPDPYKYAPQPDKVSYTAKPQYPTSNVPHTQQPYMQQQPQRQFSTSSIPPSQSREPQAAPARSSSYSSYSTQTREVKPPGSRDDRAQESSDTKGKSLRPSAEDSHLNIRAPSPGFGKRMDRLSVSGDRPDVSGHGPPPASPLLEAYHGTYQSMPSPMMLPADDIDDIPPLTSLSNAEAPAKKSVSMVEQKPQKKRVKIYDAEADADALAAAMSHATARPGPLIDVLPELTHDQLLKLRDEYKKKVKVQSRGVNIAKHIKMKTTGNFGKICYVTALGRWESESYWANFWYQSRSSSRELLIEALMGRTNADIREIKDSFRDKRYDDSLSRCMEKELKPDKFRTAVLMALEGRRQEETDPWPIEYRNQDVDVLNRALKGREGGETAILQIVVRRSDNHLREVLRAYERVHGANFAREALKKSNNLVGEVIAHILNGCINRPARDALLLRHAIEDITAHNRAVELRYELLMSRLVRLHWDRLHLGRVKEEYKKKYSIDLEADMEEATKAEFGEFCLRLCET